MGAGFPSSVVRYVKRKMRNSAAAIVRDRRAREPYTYRWLNDLTWRLVSKGGAAEIRPAYTWGVVHAAALARRLGLERVGVIEFGVAGGRGLVALERIAEKVESVLEVPISVYGFDTGAGLPKPQDYRDLPHLYLPETYVMDPGRLRALLRRATLVLGPVAETLPGFLRESPPPIGFVSIDLDYYSSTMDALRLFDAPDTTLLPRVHCYLDDIMGGTFGDCNGERLAIADFNAQHSSAKISPIYGLRHFLPWPLSTAMWPEMMYMLHRFDHRLYAANDGLVRGATGAVGRW
jgi:hypothetical protein